MFANNFVPDQVCASCHQPEYQQWQNSHHALAMQAANDKTVLGNFNNAVFKYFGTKTIFYKKNGKFYFNTQGDDGKYHNYEVKYTFGVDPLQQYLVEFPNGSMQAFSIVWDTQKKKWFHLYSHENITFKDPLFWTKRFYNWNNSCADCHSTNLKKNYNAKTNAYHTTWSATNVGCQACHGPAEDHVKWARGNKKGKDGLTVNYKNQNATQFVETCAFCHSRRHPINSEITNGTPLLNNYLPEILKEHIYYANGAIQDEDYEYGSFIQSKMFKAGVVCTDCHNPHTAKLKLEGNGLCMQCHNLNPPKQRFLDLLAKDYNSPAHTHHPLNSPGSQCVSCHMPTNTYMQIDVRHDHYFRIPRPDLTIKYGIPNACNQCHKDKSLEWAEKNIEKWYGKVSDKDDYTDILEGGRKNKPAAESDLINLAKNKEQANIVRATALFLLQSYHSSATLHTFIVLTSDPDPWVRMYAIRGLAGLPVAQKLTILTPLLNDSILAVRTEAAKMLAGVPEKLMTPLQQQTFNKALSEYKNAQNSLLDTPEANLNLALLYNVQGNNAAAQSTLEQGVTNNPDQGQLHYSLGLLLAEENKWEESRAAFAAAIKLMPNNSRLFYNYGLVLIHLNQIKEAELVLLKAQALNPQDSDILSVLKSLTSK